MDNNIEQSVYNYLTENITEINNSSDKHNLDYTESEIKAGTYSDKALQSEIYPYRDKLRQAVRSRYDAMMDSARKMVAEYRSSAERLNDLNPDDINDDIKLLQTGITLLPRDIEALLRRNSSNRTMSQLILRYAKEHGIETNSMYTGTHDEMQRAKNLESTLHYYEKWVDKPNALDILNRFFGVR